MLIIKVNDGPSGLNSAIAKWKKKISTSGLMEELKERSTYEKPSDRKRKIKNAAKYKQKIKTAEENYSNGH